MAIEWRDELSIGDATIDDDHKGLIRLINQYERAIAKHDARLLKETFKGLSDYAAAHFEREEKLMEAVYFPERRTHGDKHADLMRQVQDFHYQVLCGEKLHVDEISRFLHDWLVNHIIHEDLKLGAHVLGRRRS